MSRTKYLNPGEGFANQYGYGPRLSKRGIDIAYSPVTSSIGNSPLQAGGCGGPFGTPGATNQAGRLKFKDVVHGVEKAYNWIKKNKPVAKGLKFADNILPDEIKTNPTYSKIRSVAGKFSSQLGIGQNANILPPITYNKGMTVVNTSKLPRKRRQTGSGSKRAKLKQKGTGRKRKSKK